MTFPHRISIVRSLSTLSVVTATAHFVLGGLLSAEKSAKDLLDEERTQYRAAVVWAGADTAKRTEARQAHIERLQRILTDVSAELSPATSDEELIAVSTAAAEADDSRLLLDILNRCEATGRHSVPILRLAIRAHLRLTHFESAEQLFAQLKSLNRIDNDVDALHILFANAYQSAGDKRKATGHLRSFISYIVSALDQNPTLAESLPSLITRHQRIAEKGDTIFLSTLDERLRSILDKLKSAESFTIERTSPAKVSSLYLASASVLAETQTQDVTKVLQQWVRHFDQILSAELKLSETDLRSITAMTEQISRYSILMRDPRAAMGLRQSLTSLSNTLESKHAAETTRKVVASFRAAEDALRRRIDHLDCLGFYISGEQLNSLDIQIPADGRQKQLVICFWSPFLSEANYLLDRIERTVRSNPNARLAFVLPFTRPQSQSADQKSKQEADLALLRERLLNDPVRHIALADSGLSVMERLRVGPLPQLVVVDGRSIIREIIVGGGADQLAYLDRILVQLEEDIQRQSVARARTAPIVGNRAFVRRCCAWCTRGRRARAARRGH
jgi:hypothetical protein